jgi:hypothetical protein
MFRLNAYHPLLVSTACRLRTCSCYFLLLGPWYHQQRCESLCAKSVAVQDVARARVNGQWRSQQRRARLPQPQHCAPALRALWVEGLPLGSPRRWQRTPEGDRKAESDSEPGGKQRPSLAQSQAVATAVAVTLSEVFWKMKRLCTAYVNVVRFPSTSHQQALLCCLCRCRNCCTPVLIACWLHTS